MHVFVDVGRLTRAAGCFFDEFSLRLSFFEAIKFILFLPEI